jgi:dihydrofolate reductase
MIEMIWAMDENRLIGKGNLLPWHIKKDLDYFKEKTKNKVVLMGDRTYRSLKHYYRGKQLPFKKIYVANNEDHFAYPDAELVQDLERFLATTDEDLIVIGGRTVYAIALPYASRLYITYVLGTYEGDVYFPDFCLSDFKLVKKVMEERLIFAVYERI